MGSFARPGREFSEGADLDVAEPNVIAVILQANVAARIFGEAGHALEFGFGDELLGLGAAPLVLDDFLLLSQCSAWLPLITMRALFHSPTGLSSFSALQAMSA